jgi:hypothetical protein
MELIFILFLSPRFTILLLFAPYFPFVSSLFLPLSFFLLPFPRIIMLLLFHILLYSFFVLSPLHILFPSFRLFCPTVLIFPIYAPLWSKWALNLLTCTELYAIMLQLLYFIKVHLYIAFLVIKSISFETLQWEHHLPLWIFMNFLSKKKIFLRKNI